MARIFTCLAIGQFIVFAIAGVLGLLSSGNSPDRHVALGVFSVLLSCFTQVVVFTYFTVSGKIMAQALHLGRLDLAPLVQVKRFKSKIIYNLAFALTSILAVTITGAYHWRTGDRSILHMTLAGLCIAIHTLVFYRQYDLIVRNGSLMNRIMETYSLQKERLKSQALTQVNHSCQAAAKTE